MFICVARKNYVIWLICITYFVLVSVNFRCGFNRSPDGPFGQCFSRAVKNCCRRISLRGEEVARYTLPFLIKTSLGRVEH